MPFDGVEFFADQYLQKIDAVIDLIGTADRWGKGSFRTPDGRYCLRGAIRALDTSEALGPVVLDAINQVTWRRYWHIERFNDSAWTNHELVLAVLIIARENIAAGRFVIAPRLTTRRTVFRRWWSRAAAWFDQSPKPVGATAFHTADDQSETVLAPSESTQSPATL